MSARKKKRKKKRNNAQIFLLTLLLTVAAGGVFLLGVRIFGGAGLTARGTGAGGTAFARNAGGGAGTGGLFGGGADGNGRNGLFGGGADGTGAGGTGTGVGAGGGANGTGSGAGGTGSGSGTGGTDGTGTGGPGTAAGSSGAADPASADGSRYGALLADPEPCREQNIYPMKAADPEEVSLVFAGDILFDDRYAVMASLQQRGGQLESCFSEDVLDVTRGADIFMVNNEFPYTDRGEPMPEKKFTFRAKPEYASYLFDMGADVVSLANNHAHDYGQISLTDTLSTLANLGMPWVGAGRNLAEASRPVYFIANDIKIAILSATQIERMDNPSTKGATETEPGVFRCLDLTRLLEEIREAKQNSDFVIVYVHWGTENMVEVDWAQAEQGPQIAQAGADLIIGDHPHILQPLGYCGDVPVVYSLGNFWFNSKTLDNCLVRVKLDRGGLKSLQFIPGIQSGCSVSLADGAEKERILSYIRSISPDASIDADGFVTKAPQKMQNGA